VTAVLVTAVPLNAIAKMRMLLFPGLGSVIEVTVRDESIPDIVSCHTEHPGLRFCWLPLSLR